MSWLYTVLMIFLFFVMVGSLFYGMPKKGAKPAPAKDIPIPDLPVRGVDPDDFWDSNGYRVTVWIQFLFTLFCGALGLLVASHMDVINKGQDHWAGLLTWGGLLSFLGLPFIALSQLGLLIASVLKKKSWMAAVHLIGMLVAFLSWSAFCSSCSHLHMGSWC